MDNKTVIPKIAALISLTLVVIVTLISINDFSKPSNLAIWTPPAYEYLWNIGLLVSCCFLSIVSVSNLFSFYPRLLSVRILFALISFLSIPLTGFIFLGTVAFIVPSGCMRVGGIETLVGLAGSLASFLTILIRLQRVFHPNKTDIILFPQKMSLAKKLIMLCFGLLILSVIFVPVIERVINPPPPPWGKLRCSKNLMGLYTAMLEYELEYHAYPKGIEYRGSKFWEVFRTIPVPEKSILFDLKGKEHSLYICPFRGGKGDYGICHYRGPNYDVTDDISGNIPLASDLSENHGDGTINVLYINGIVDEVKRGTPEWEKAEKYLTK